MRSLSVGARALPAGLALALAVVVGLAGGPLRADAQARCAGFPPLADITTVSLDGFAVIVSGIWVETSEGRTAIEPEAFLKGPAIATPLLLGEPQGDARSECPPARLVSGTRVLAPLRRGLDAPSHPDIHTVFVLEDGRASHPDGSESLAEAELVERIRGVTNQYAVPAANASERASIDWLRVVLPVAGAVLGIFVAGLVLMRVWHRIDPT